jgi:hypothetical protein
MDRIHLQLAHSPFLPSVSASARLTSVSVRRSAPPTEVSSHWLLFTIRSLFPCLDLWRLQWWAPSPFDSICALIVWSYTCSELIGSLGLFGWVGFVSGKFRSRFSGGRAGRGMMVLATTRSDSFVVGFLGIFFRLGFTIWSVLSFDYD